MKKRRILVAMSGGVDSSVAAALLKEQGHEVGGATIRTWASGKCADLNTKACCGITGVEDARDVAASLDIPYWVLNFENEFKKHVVDYFTSEYLKGRTPNPCVACNEHIKFRLFLEKARQLGFDTIATGHYAALRHDEAADQMILGEGRDAGKDQSYVLFPLSRDLLKNLILPLGGYTKAEIRSKARELDLCVSDKPDSQEICFIPSNNYREFMGSEVLENQTHEGNIVTRQGKVVGKHQGHYFFTRGQRRGLGIAHTERLYVLETRPDCNEVVVGTKEEVYGIRFTVGRVNWFAKPENEERFPAHVKIRSQHAKAPAHITVLDSQKVQVEFEEPQDAITPGQGAVFYRESQVLGGGWIDFVG